MPFSIRQRSYAFFAAVLIVGVFCQSGSADEAQSAVATTKSEALPANIKKVIHHGRMLSHPATQPENTKFAVSYELGHCLQLDRDHCLLVASMDEQGGGDLCVGNDGFVIQNLTDIAAEKAIPLNRAVQDYVAKTWR